MLIQLLHAIRSRVACWRARTLSREPPRSAVEPTHPRCRPDRPGRCPDAPREPPRPLSGDTPTRPDRDGAMRADSDGRPRPDRPLGGRLRPCDGLGWVQTPEDAPRRLESRLGANAAKCLVARLRRRSQMYRTHVRGEHSVKRNGAFRSVALSDRAVGTALVRSRTFRVCARMYVCQTSSLDDNLNLSLELS